mmetsp:Transcript_28045/g.72150  ORF Transcript_28045/g.72150 Transcript_28045/m.72150 type:complete len:263 (+) Transcript_28045:360-1148(+)
MPSQRPPGLWTKASAEGSSLHVPAPQVGGVGVALQGLVALCGEQLVGAEQARLGERGLVLLELIEPLLGVVGVPVIWEPGATLGVVDGARELAVHLLHGVPIYQEVPGVRDGAYEVVVGDPGEAVQVGAALRVDQAQLDGLVGRVAAVPKHHAAPVLAGVGALCATRELLRHGRLVVVLDAHDGLAVIDLVQQVGDVALEQEVIVHKHGPALVVVQVGHKEAAVGEFGALLRVLRACVDTALLQLRALQGDDLHRDRRALLK